MGSLHCARSGCVWAPIFCPIRPSLIRPLGHRSQTFFCWVWGRRVCGLIRCLDPAWCLRAGEGSSASFITILFRKYWKWERFRRPSTSQLQCWLVPGGWRKGRPDELLPIAVGGVIPGVGLDDELLAAKAQATPARQKTRQEMMAMRECRRNCGYTHCLPGRAM